MVIRVHLVDQQLSFEDRSSTKSNIPGEKKCREGIGKGGNLPVSFHNKKKECVKWAYSNKKQIESVMWKYCKDEQV